MTVYCISWTKPGNQLSEPESQYDCFGSTDALTEGLRLGGWGARVVVRPLIETTRITGFSRWPHPLHAQAAPEARAGWEAARLRHLQGPLGDRVPQQLLDDNARALKQMHPNGGW